jgi:hypothetical protein
MRMKSAFFACIFLLVCAISPAQETKKLSVKLELGNSEVTGSLYDNWNIRQDVGSYYETTYNAAATDMFATNIAVKLEYALFDNKIALASGLQLTNLSSSLYVDNYRGSNNAFFYLRYSDSGFNTNFAKVSSIAESTNYLSVPLDVRVSLFSIRKVRFFARTGIDLGLHIGSTTKINFLSADMKPYENDVLNDLNVTQNDIISSWNTSVGASFGKTSKLHYNIEVLLPSFYLTKNNSSILKDEVFTGFKISAQLPVR